MNHDLDEKYDSAVSRCYWLFRLGYQRILLNFRFRKFEKLSENNSIGYEDDLLRHAFKAIHEAEFACKYGKPGNPLLREFATYLEKNNIITQPELRRLIQGGDLGQDKKGKIYIKPPYRVAIGGILFGFFSAIAIILFSYFIPGIPMSLHYKITLLLIFYGLLFCGTYVFRFYTVQPYKTLKALPAYLDAFLKKNIFWM